MRRPFTRVNIRRAGREAVAAGLLGNLISLVSIAVFAVPAVLLLVRGIEAYHAQGPGGIAGIVTITDCAPTHGKVTSGWNCSGTFVSAGGTIRIERVEMFPVFPASDQAPTGDYDARVASAASHIATEPASWRWAVPFGAGLAFAAFALYMGYSMYFKFGPEQPEPDRPDPRVASRIRRAARARRAAARHGHAGRRDRSGRR